jgi:hypothetical protein
MPTPKVFLSYSHDSEPHKRWALQLAKDLRLKGVEAILDQWDLGLGQDMAAFMERGIVEASRVLMICSENYVQKAEKGRGGVGYERLIVTAELLENIDTNKFIPVIRGNPSPRKMPRFLGPRRYIDFSIDNDYAVRLEELVREIHGIPADPRPALGPRPFDSSSSSIRADLDTAWFDAQSGTGTEGVTGLALDGHMELRFALGQPIRKSPNDLLIAAEKAQIHTFGWPIGAVLSNFRPRPFKDGIRAEIRIQNSMMTGRPTYDYWALRSDGAFYLLQSLFEDDRGEKKIFFEIRIVRVTEALLYAARLYRNLGVPPDATVAFRVSHRGLAGRTLTSAGRRMFFPQSSEESEAQAETIVTLGTIGERLVEEVRQLLEPLFILFDFTRFDEGIYVEIVEEFRKRCAERGEV